MYRMLTILYFVFRMSKMSHGNTSRSISLLYKENEPSPKCLLKSSIDPSFYTGFIFVYYSVGIAFSFAVHVFTMLLGTELKISTLLIITVSTLTFVMCCIATIYNNIGRTMIFKFNR